MSIASYTKIYSSCRSSHDHSLCAHSIALEGACLGPSDLISLFLYERVTNIPFTHLRINGAYVYTHVVLPASGLFLVPSFGQA